MKHEKMRIARIADEIINYLYSLGAKDISINIKEDKEKFKLKFKSDYKDISQEKINDLVKICNTCSKANEMEEFYWELLGDTDSDSELSLMRMMIDEIEIDIQDDYIEMILIRKKS